MACNSTWGDSIVIPYQKRKEKQVFDGTESDGKKSLRVVAFLESSRQAVDLKDCQVLRARRGDHVEIVLKF